MQPELYGSQINRIILNCAFSFFDNNHCKTNIIIYKSDKKITTKKAYLELQKMYTQEEIEKNGYYLRNRFEFGPFRKDTGKMKITIHFEKEFSELSHFEQRQKLCDYFIFALNKTIEN